ncbi:NtrZ family periplasmic regulatory protein [Brevundimonas sp. A19_0]|uniref:NtrZ family periplasmic regulatory protein n=1 Tax=Brevundimonas sp. A19_0 TaxID=2821087 RepID=UPI001FD8258E|nr:hypothetical protein [Brevundimonas sp. A19_0]
MRTGPDKAPRGPLGVCLALPLAVAVVGLALLPAPEASAQSRTQTSPRAQAPAVSLSDADRAARSGQRRGLRVNESGRWGLDFNLSQPVGREAEWGDVEAGAYYRVNPSLRVGAAAGLATPDPDPARLRESDTRTQPRVRLESIFRF